MWRWSWYFSFVLRQLLVFSTYVEVILPVIPLLISPIGILHVCGGDPNMKKERLITSEYSPRMWRWSSCTTSCESWGAGILHVCGGDPQGNATKPTNAKYSPRMWRWSQLTSGTPTMVPVFSTYVEVILARYRSKRNDYCILHTCWECYCPWAHR